MDRLNPVGWVSSIHAGGDGSVLSRESRSSAADDRDVGGLGRTQWWLPVDEVATPNRAENVGDRAASVGGVSDSRSAATESVR